MNLTIKSKILGESLTFSRPGSEYIFVDVNGESGTLGKQPCKGGGFMGSTLTYSGDDQKAFEIICRNWYRAYVKHATFDGLIGY